MSSADLPPCLDAVLAQDYQNFSVLVVNDRSEDPTAAIVREYIAHDSRLRLEQVTSLPAGWTGKAHAMWFGTQQATAEWLLFVNADVTLEPFAVRAAVQEALAKRVALLTAYPRAAREGFWQQVSLPLLGSMLMLWYRPDWVNDPANPMGFVNGQFLLMRRNKYLSGSNGHRSVRDTLIEDVPFGGVAKRAGVACRLAVLRNIWRAFACTRAFGRWSTAFRGFISAQFQGRTKLVASAVGLLINLAPLVILIALGLLTAVGSAPWTSARQGPGQPCLPRGRPSSSSAEPTSE